MARLSSLSGIRHGSRTKRLRSANEETIKASVIGINGGTSRMTKSYFCFAASRNLFIASEVEWKERNVRIRQETRFPEDQSTTIAVRTGGPTRFALRLRLPSWTADGFGVRLNGEPVDTSPDGTGYVVVERTWSDGDRVDVKLPMRLGGAPMPDDPTLVAVTYGPLVLAGRLNGERLQEDDVYTTENWFRFPARLVAKAPTIIAETSDPAEWVRAVAGEPLTFRTAGVGRPEDVTLVPYHRLWGERYAVYWRVWKEGEWKRAEAERQKREAELQALLRRRVDHVVIGDEASERAHSLEGENTASGGFQDRSWRHAADGGWFSYRLKVYGKSPMSLQLTYWGDESGRRTFDVLVEGEKLATQTLLRNRPGEFFEVRHELPESLTQGKSEVTVRFQAHPGNTAGGVFGLWILRKGE